MVLKLEKGLNFCLSKIGAGGTLCLRKDCLIGNHLSGEKFVVDEHGSILVQKNSNVGFCEPTADASQLSDEVWDDWKVTSLSLGTWRDHFLTIDSKMGLDSLVQHGHRSRS
jgi:hypothetical protein